MSTSNPARAFRFRQAASHDDVPNEARECRFTIAEHERLRAAFAEHMRAAAGGAADARPRCHIIGCITTPDGLECWYHCH